jgi:cation transport ATPase
LILLIRISLIKIPWQLLNLSHSNLIPSYQVDIYSYTSLNTYTEFDLISFIHSPKKKTKKKKKKKKTKKKKKNKTKTKRKKEEESSLIFISLLWVLVVSLGRIIEITVMLVLFFIFFFHQNFVLNWSVPILIVLFMSLLLNCVLSERVGLKNLQRRISFQRHKVLM